MRKCILKILVFSIIFSFLLIQIISAEDKPDVLGVGPNLTVEKLTDAELKDGPMLFDDGVYPFFGTTCSNYTYKVYYKDAKGRAPTYMRIWINGEWHDMQKIKGDFKNGALYIFNLVPTSGEQVFYYFEASNGVGKARAGIIDSPDQGPIFFSEKLDNNHIFLLDKNGKLVWSYSTKNDWAEAVAISKNNYVAAVTGYYIYLFKNSSEPIWKFCQGCEVPEVTLGNFAGVDISADGNYVAGTLQSELYFFSKDSNKPLWKVDLGSSSEGISVSDNGDYIAASSGSKLSLFDKSGKLLWKYETNNPGYDTSGEMYRPSITPDANYIAVSTGCPDRRAYLFSRDGKLIFKSNMLTKDSPVHKSAISNDGSLIAYSADNMDGKGLVWLFDRSGKILWSFSSPDDSTARAVSISENGKYAAIGTSKGHIYLFSKEDSSPLWTFTDTGNFRQFGEVELSSTGDYLVAGGTTKKIYMFAKNSNKPVWEYTANTWITRVDFNGEYVVAGTGPREYVFEGSSVGSEKVVCKEIRQFAPFWLTGADVQSGNKSTTVEGSGVCGNNLCEPNKGEDDKNCPSDCIPGEFVGENEENVEGNPETTTTSNATVLNEEDLSQELKKCGGFVDKIINFFYSLVGKQICK